MASSSSKDTEVDKILAVSVAGDLVEISLYSESSRVLIESDDQYNRNVLMVGGRDEFDDDTDSEKSYLFEISLSSKSSWVLVEHDYKLNKGCSFSPPIDNRYVFIVGGGDEYHDIIRRKAVTYFDLSDPDRKLYQAPPISYPIWEPFLVVLGSKLFIFYDYSVRRLHLLAEVLDTACAPLCWQPLQSLPKLSFGDNDPHCYTVVSYATNIHNLFLSLGDVDTSYAVCYNDSENRWCFLSEKPLPFYHQGIFVNDICYGFPKLDKFACNNIHYLASYNLSVDWKRKDPMVFCQELARYSLSMIPLPHRSYLHSLFVSSSDLFTIIALSELRNENPSLEAYAVVLSDPTKKRKKRPSPPPPPPTPLPRYNKDSYRFIDVIKRHVPPEIDDTEGSSHLVKYTFIPVLDRLQGILGDYNL